MSTDDTASARAADAKQAAYFRAELHAHRQHLVAQISKRRQLIERRSHTGRLRNEVYTTESEVRHLDRMIADLDGRFGAAWALAD